MKYTYLPYHIRGSKLYLPCLVGPRRERTAIENMSYEMGYFEEKYYKTGFADGVRLIMECVER